MRPVRLTAAVAGAALLAATAAAVAWTAAAQAPAPAPAAPATSSTIERGRYLATVGDCAACHTRADGEAFAGGAPLKTPFGTIYSTNITPDHATGIGAWTPAQFYEAMHHGKRPDGANLYPAFPYPYFTHVTRADTDAIFAYLQSQKAVSYNAPANGLPFPLNIRAVVKVWNWLNFRPDETGAVAHGSQGEYLVAGLGHCGACHTPKTLLGGDKGDQALRGGLLDNWFAPSLLPEAGGGLKDWSEADIAEFLKTSRNAHSNAAGAMSEVIEKSTSNMTDADLAAIAGYLKGLPAPAATRPAIPDETVMRTGKAIYVDECASCHGPDGAATPRLFPPLAGNANVQASNPATLARYILGGSQSATTAARPTASSMPSFAWLLNDAQAAAVATYVRNAWGNAAAPVSADQMAKVRRAVAAHPVTKPSAKV